VHRRTEAGRLFHALGSETPEHGVTTYDVYYDREVPERI